MAAPLPDPAADAPREAFRLTIEGGETDQAAAAAGVATDGREHRHLEVKGRTQPVDVVVVRTQSNRRARRRWTPRSQDVPGREHPSALAPGEWKMDLDFNTLIQTATLALVTVVTAIVAIVRGTVEEAAKAGAARHAELKAENANWRTKLDQELEQVRGTERQELRFDAYAGLWKKQRPLAIYEPGKQGGFGPKEADALLRAQSDWYFDEAGGLMLTTHVRDFYFTWQDLLRAVATTPGWRAQRSTGNPAEVFRNVLAAAGRPKATATLDYLKEAEGALSTWTMQAGTRADTWRKEIGGLSDEWLRLNSEQQWAVLQQVSSTLRTAMVFDLESRMR